MMRLCRRLIVAKGFTGRLDEEQAAELEAVAKAAGGSDPSQRANDPDR